VSPRAPAFAGARGPANDHFWFYLDTAVKPRYDTDAGAVRGIAGGCALIYTPVAKKLVLKGLI